MPRVAALCLLALAAAVAGCGDDGGAGVTTVPESTRAGFPDRKRTLLELRGGVPVGPVLSPRVSVLSPGRNRVSFTLLDPPNEAARPYAVALYTARLGGRGVRGPFLARRETLRVPARFRSRRRLANGEAPARDLWVAQVPFERSGRFILTGLTRPRDGDDVAATNQLELRVDGATEGPPRPGERAVRVRTDPADSRRPPLTALHRTDLADVLGRRPVVLAFASPGRCPTSECAQLVDAAATVRARTGITVIAQETFRTSDLEDGFRAQARRWRLPSPAWTFVIDARGRISDRFEGAVSVRELRQAAERVLGRG